MQDVYDKAKSARLAIFDVDGVLTDGVLYYSDSGVEIKAFNVRDGHGMKMLQASGVHLAIDLLYQGASDKLTTCRQLLERVKLEPAAAAYIGDDLVDLPVLMHCGLAVTVPEAPPAVRRHAHYVTRAKGGHGAARELCELIMHAQGTLEAQAGSHPIRDQAENGADPA